MSTTSTSQGAWWRTAEATLPRTRRWAPTRPTGDPARVLVAEAEQGGYDLLVTGNKGLTGLRRLAPGDKVPAKVAHHLPCSLLVVKTT